MSTTLKQSESNDKPLVLNVFCFGTHRGPQSFGLITNFYNACAGEKIALAGPGGKAKNNPIKKTAHKLSGAFGVGVDARVKEGVRWLERQLKSVADDQPVIVNVLAYSRGGHVATKFAQKIAKKHLNVRFNIAVEDNVAGPGNRIDKSARVIPWNVKSYLNIEREHETRVGFQSQSMSKQVIVEQPFATAAHTLLMPGTHTDGVRIKPGGPKSAYRLTHDIFYKKMSGWGTKFIGNAVPRVARKAEDGTLQNDPTLAMNNYNVLKAYQQLRADIPKYKAKGMKGQSARGKLQWRIGYRAKRATQREQHVLNTDFFIDQYEREIFKQTYPKIFDYMFQKAVERSSVGEVKGELEIMKAKNSNLYTQVLSYHITHKNIGLSQPLGIKIIEKCSLIKDIPLAKVTADNFSQVAKSICQRYMSKRGAYGHRVFHSKAGEILDKIYKIMKNEEVYPNTIEAIEVLVRSELVDMERQHPNSELTRNFTNLINNLTPPRDSNDGILMRCAKRIYSCSGLNRVINTIQRVFASSPRLEKTSVLQRMSLYSPSASSSGSDTDNEAGNAPGVN